MKLTTDFILQTGQAIYRSPLYRECLGINEGEVTYFCAGEQFELLPVKYRDEGYRVTSSDGVIDGIMWNIELIGGLPYPILYIALDGPKGVKVYGEKVAGEIIKHSTISVEAASYLNYMNSQLVRYTEMKDMFDDDDDEVFNVKKWKCKQKIAEYRGKIGVVNNVLAFLLCNNINTSPIFTDMSLLKLTPDLVRLFMFLSYLTRDSAFSMKLCMLMYTEGISAKQHGDILSIFENSGDYYQIDVDLDSGEILRGLDSYACYSGDDIVLSCPQMLYKAARKLHRHLLGSRG